MCSIACSVHHLDRKLDNRVGIMGRFDARHEIHHVLGGVTCPNATCLIRYKLCCVFRRVKDHHKFAIISVCLKKTCVRQVVLDKRFPLNAVALPACLYLASSLRRRACGRPDILQYNSIHLYIYICMS